ncbi:MAG: hypothetical protein IPK19_14030 [Chloroflexi bacterium]|nr:hypothetical protein [Chloroflexota bacterium]
MSHYRVYGLSIRTDRAIPGILEVEDDAAVDVQVWFDDPARDPSLRPGAETWSQHPRYINHRINTGYGEVLPGLRLFASPDGAYTRLHYAEDVIFTVDAGARQVYVQAPVGMSMESVCAYLLNPVLAFCLRVRGQTGLHASAIAVNHEAIIFAAPSGSGKSTLAYEFARRGHTVLTDDVSVLVDLNGQIGVQPGYPHVRLWPWTVDELLGDETALPLIAPDWNKRFLDLRGDRYRFADKPLPVSAVFLIDPYGSALEIKPMAPKLALMALMDNTYLNYMIDNAMRGDDFRWLARLTTQAPVYTLTRPSDMTRLPDLYEAVLHRLAVPSGV